MRGASAEIRSRGATPPSPASAAASVAAVAAAAVVDAVPPALSGEGREGIS